MPLFSYTGIGPMGREERGTLDAPDRASVERQIASRGVVLSAVHEATDQDRAQAVLRDESERRATSVLRGWEVLPETTSVAASPRRQDDDYVPLIDYFPLFDTVRLYAGWLLAWYGLVFALGGYQATKTLPFELPLVYGLAQSPLVLTFAFATFLLLLLSTISRQFRLHTALHVVLAIVWALGVYLFRSYL